MLLSGRREQLRQEEPTVLFVAPAVQLRQADAPVSLPISPALVLLRQDESPAAAVVAVAALVAVVIFVVLVLDAKALPRLLELQTGLRRLRPGFGEPLCVGLG